MAKPELRPIRIEGNLAFITLTKGYEAIIDADDVDIVARYHWSARIVRNTVYGQRADWSTGKMKLVRLHREIMQPPDGLVVDHISGDGLDNRRSNMRLVTVALNARNQRLKGDNTSGLKGVSWRSDTRKWRANINLDGKQYSLGCYNTKDQASAAYAEASARLHGEFGRLF